VLLVAGVLVNVGFLLINLKPERPHLSRRHKVKVLIRASPWRAQWMKANLFDEFGVANDLEIEPVLAKDFDEVMELLQKEKEHPTGILLADVSDEYGDDLRSEGLVAPLQDAAPPDDLALALTEYQPEAIARARTKDKLWFVPKRALVDVAAFLRPAVEDLYLNWEKDRAAIDAALREANGVGLPRNYQLEKTPSSWDTFDLFVAGWYWAHHPALWSGTGEEGERLPRLGLRTGLNEDALDDLFGRLYAHGFKEEELEQFDAQSVVDTLQWDALFQKHHLFTKEAESPAGVDGPPINALLKKRQLAWAPIDQADSLWVHGGARRDADPGMANAQDLDWATLPAGASLELDPVSGEPKRMGRSVALEVVHFWALPVHAAGDRRGWDLARFVTQRGLHQRETEALGLLPVRQDLAVDYPILFRLDWMQRMLDASYRQLQIGTADLPDDLADRGFDKGYVGLRAAVLAGEPEVTAAGVRARVAHFKAAWKAPEGAHGN
jgi:hypothetical protein